MATVDSTEMAGEKAAVDDAGERQVGTGPVGLMFSDHVISGLKITSGAPALGV